MKNFTGNKITPGDLTVDVVYSLPTRRAMQGHYVETDADTGASAQEVSTAVKSLGALVNLVPVPEDTISKTVHGLTGNLIFNLIEWTGLDLPLSDKFMAEIENSGTPFTGASRKNFMLAADKIALKNAFDANGIPTPKWQIFLNGKAEIDSDLIYPVIVKPALEHCSIGLTAAVIARDQKQLKEIVGKQLKTHQQPVIAEQFVTGREFQVSVLNNNSNLWVLPPAEITYSGGPGFLTYESRWEEKTADYKNSHIKPAVLDADLLGRLEAVSCNTFTRLGFSDYTRLDIRMNGNEILVLEANSNPGLTDDDEYGMALSCQSAGLTFNGMIRLILTSCLARYQVKLV